MIPISVVIFTKNEETNIAQCINSVSNFSQIVVVDSNSSDSTGDIAKSLNVDFYSFNWNGKYPKKRQWSLENIYYKNDWIFFLDADERMTGELSKELIANKDKATEEIKVEFQENDVVIEGRSMREAATNKALTQLRIVEMFKMLVPEEKGFDMATITYDMIEELFPFAVQMQIIDRISQTISPTYNESKGK